MVRESFPIASDVFRRGKVPKLMNRVNFARCSNVIVDVCKAHGTWFDKEELRRTVEFTPPAVLKKPANASWPQWKKSEKDWWPHSTLEYRSISKPRQLPKTMMQAVACLGRLIS